VMDPSPLSIYIETVRSAQSSTPAMMDEMSIFTLVSAMTGQHIVSYEDLTEASVTSIFIYDIPEDKKEFNIETVRRCISDINLMPYTGKYIYILRHFSTATLWAQNALLKILEECPSYAVILLEIDNPNSILDTIRSRVIDLTSTMIPILLSQAWQDIIRYYREGKKVGVAATLYGIRPTSDEAIAILRWVYPYLDQADTIRCDEAIEALAATHENPRSLLDIFFL
jgi:DNA polymerase III delta prime subunit